MAQGIRKLEKAADGRAVSKATIAQLAILAAATGLYACAAKRTPVVPSLANPPRVEVRQ